MLSPTQVSIVLKYGRRCFSDEDQRSMFFVDVLERLSPLTIVGERPSLGELRSNMHYAALETRRRAAKETFEFVSLEDVGEVAENRPVAVDDALSARIASLRPQLREVADLLAAGFSQREVAAKLGQSVFAIHRKVNRLRTSLA